MIVNPDMEGYTKTLNQGLQTTAREAIPSIPRSYFTIMKK